MTIAQSKFLAEYKREVRDALKRKKAKGHEPKLFRLYDKCLHPADDAAGKGMSVRKSEHPKQHIFPPQTRTARV